MNKKNRVNTNILPKDMMIKYTYKKCMFPIIVILIITSSYLGINTVGSKYLGDKYLTQAEELKNKSVYGENLILEKEIVSLQNDINDKEKIVESMTLQNQSVTEEIIEDNYRVDSLINYIYQIKPKNITLILVEDIDTNGKENREAVEEVKVVEETEGTKGNEEADGKEAAGVQDITGIGENIDFKSESNEFSLKYREDIGRSSIQIRGFSTEKESLAGFLKVLGRYDGMRQYKVNAVEAVKLLDDDLDVFDITILPR